MSTATVVVLESATRRSTRSGGSKNKATCHHGEDTPTTISIIHHRSIMRSDKEDSWAERNESKNYHRTTSSPAVINWKLGEESSRTFEDASLLDDDEAEPGQAFMFTKSPVPSLRRVGVKVLDTEPRLPLASHTTPRLSVLERTTSAPIPSNCYCSSKLAQEGQDGNHRRSIFGPFWESSSMAKQKELPRRGHCMDVLETSCPRRRERSLPNHLTSMSLRTQEEYIAALDGFFPSVPAPLERLLSRSSGVYPLSEPKSILKKDDGNVDSVVGLKQTLIKFPSDGSNAVEDNATDTTCASSTLCKSVHFDPRVVVTEVDDPFPRRWYSDQELQKFQSDTCKLAKTYLQMHPELIPLYSKPVYDPTIKKMRRKPLFGLQGLSDLDVCLNAMPIKRILVVSPHDKILSLLCRSLQTIFPAAEMVRAYNGMSALDILKRSAVDMVICQENLLPRNCATPAEVDTSSGLFSKYQREEEEKWRRTLLISISAMTDKPAQRFFVGHGATDFIWTLPPPKMNLGLQGTLVVALEKKRRGDSHLE
jgi:hypothetical protein